MKSSELDHVIKVGTRILIEVEVIECVPSAGGRGWHKDSDNKFCVRVASGINEKNQAWVRTEDIKSVAQIKYEDVDHGR